MKKVKEIIITEDRKGVHFRATGFSNIEIIGLLTYYRDSLEVGMMRDNTNIESKKIPDTGPR